MRRPSHTARRRSTPLCRSTPHASLPCTQFRFTRDKWSDPKWRFNFFLTSAVMCTVLLAIIITVATVPERLNKLTVVGVFASIVVAIANGANDIANSVGTSYGAGAMTLRQCIIFGSIAECVGAMTMGATVAKSISKGVIDPDGYAEDGCQGTLNFGVGMLAVMLGTGSTTLLATFYGAPT